MHYIRRLIALASQGNRRHVGGIRFQYNTTQGDASRQYFWQMTFLESQHTSDTQHKAVELQQLSGFLLVARKAVEHASRQVVDIFLQNSHHLVLRLPAVYHQGQLQFY